MKKLFIILLIMLSFSVSAQEKTEDLNKFDLKVIQTMVKVYENFLSEQDSVMRIKQTDGRNNILSMRKTYTQLVADSLVAQRDSSDLKLFIIKPRLVADTIQSGALVEIFWLKVPRQKIDFFEKLKK